jgi:cytochrome c biogenesis protein CcmG/thiol:disulfide interchange protein DsbE
MSGTFLQNRWLRAVIVIVVVAVLGWSYSRAGAPAALDYTLKDMHGKDVRLADFKGRPILINFWATWCPPCKAEIPWFIEFTEKYKAQNFTVIGISIDDSPEDIRKFADEYKVNYPMLVGVGEDELQQAYEAGFAVPVSWFIKADGTVATKAMGIHPKEWFEEQVKALIAESHE